MHFSPQLFALAGPFRWRLAGLILVGLGITVFNLLTLGLAGYAIGAVFSGRAGPDLVPVLLGAAASLIIRGLLVGAKEPLAVALAAKIKTHVRTRVYRHLVVLGVGYLDRKETGQLLALGLDNVEALEAYYARYLPQVLVTTFAPLGIFVFLWTIHPSLAAILAATLVLALVMPGLFRKSTRKFGGLFWMRYGRLSATVVDSIQGLPTLKAFARSRQRGAEIERQADEVAQSMVRVFAISMASIGLMDLIVIGGSTVLLGTTAFLTSQGIVATSLLVVVLILGNEVFRPIRELSGLFHQGQNAIASAEAILAVLAEKPEVTDPERPSPPPAVPSITFDSVTFAYDGGERPALASVSLTIEPGERVALVGPSGAGKTTVLSLILRFHDPQSGVVQIGGCPVNHLRLADLRQLFSVVSQDTYLFHGTIAQNLRLARPDCTDDQIRDAARAANIDEFIQSLPLGYDTVVGERGVRLSGGERQRVAIARAILKDAPILLLDEPTSSVDAENEGVIQAALDRLAAGRTTLIIAHRLSTIANADRILVLENGRVLEEGSHERLLVQGGLYRRLVTAQQAPPALVGGVA